MPPIAELVQTLEREGGHDGLLDFLNNANPDSLAFESGEPTCPDEQKIKTNVLVVPFYDNSVILAVHPFNFHISWQKLKMTLRIMTPIERAGPEVLKSIGMRPERCHPFPDMKYFRDETLQGLYVDAYLTEWDKINCFPVYSSADNGRIGSLYIHPTAYFNAMKKLVSETTECSDEIVQWLDFIDDGLGNVYKHVHE